MAQLNSDKKFSVAKRLKSFSYAFNGLKCFFKTQHNVWIHLCVLKVVIIAGFYFNISTAEWIYISLAAGFVLVAEAFNTSIEVLVDLVSPQHNEKAGLIKDIVAGAVLISSITAAIVGTIIFLPKLCASFF